jgi:hypothetical protein
LIRVPEFVYAYDEMGIQKAQKYDFRQIKLTAWALPQALATPR